MAPPSRLSASLLVAAAACGPAFVSGQVVISSVVETFQWRDPWGGDDTPAGYEATCESRATFDAAQYSVADLNEAYPRGLQPWAEAIPYFFGGRPYPGAWDGVDNKGTAREIMVMEFTDVPDPVKDWIEEQRKDGENDNRYLFAVYEKPKSPEDKIMGISKVRESGEGAIADEDKVLMFAAGALYDTLPLWVAKDSDCQDALADLQNYGPWPADEKVIAWPIQRTAPEGDGKPLMQFTVKAQLLHETDEGRAARLQREKEEQEKMDEAARAAEEAQLEAETLASEGAGDSGETAGDAPAGSEGAGGSAKDEL